MSPSPSWGHSSSGDRVARAHASCGAPARAGGGGLGAKPLTAFQRWCTSHLYTWICCYAGVKLAPAVGLEPTASRLTADRSTTELRGSVRRGPDAAAHAASLP